MKFASILGAIAALLTTSAAHAWNDRGHMMVAAVAWEQLTDTAKAHAVELLKLNPQYGSWVNGAAEADRDEIAFVRAATWSDFIKRSSAGFTNDGEDPSVPSAMLNIGYADHFQHRYWHYIDLPFANDGTPLIQPKAPNAETQINTFRDPVASEAGDDVRSYDLVWLLHLVGDVHQPLHATSRFSRDLPDGDRGGNLVFLCSPAPCSKELHAFWDDVLGTSSSVLQAIKAAQRLPGAPAGGVAVADPHAWVVESFNIARDAVYAGPIGNGGGTFTLTDDYVRTAKRIAEEQVALAGARLAALLNAALP
jgi:S1/P1 Nuclease